MVGVIDLQVSFVQTQRNISVDPNPNTYKQYLKQIETYNSFLSQPKKVTIYNCGAEDLPWDKIDNIDCVFYITTILFNRKI